MKFKKKIIKMKHRRDLRGERGLKVELPIVVIRKRRRSGAAKIDAVGMMGVRSMDS